MNAFTDLKDSFLIIESANPWQGTPLENYYALNPSQKGTSGENIVSSILEKLGYEVKPRTNPGHDRIVNGIKTEIKFATAVKRNYDYKCIFNHIGLEKDWEQILFVCVNGDGDVKATFFEKGRLPMELLSRQQGGKDGENDDFMVQQSKSSKLLDSPLGRSLF